jgi:transcriptional regulator with XRE-family HTH domain
MGRTRLRKLGGRLLAERKRRGLTQAQLGAASGLNRTAISHFEAGRREPNLPNLVRLAEALGITTDHLLGHGRDEADGKADRKGKGNGKVKAGRAAQEKGESR